MRAVLSIYAKRTCFLTAILRFNFSLWQRRKQEGRWAPKKNRAQPYFI
jgi:hypothetical protein